MDKLTELLDDDDIGFENMDTCFPSVSSTSTSESDDDEEPIIEKPVKKRGRKPKEPVVDEDETTSTKSKTAVKKTKKDETLEENPPEKTKISKKKSAKKSSSDLDNLPKEKIDQIVQNYSMVSLDTLSSMTGLTEEDIQKVISTVQKLFIVNITTGDITQEFFDDFIAPLFIPYKESPLNSYVSSEIARLKKEHSSK